MVPPARDREALEQAVVRGSELLKQSRLDQALQAFRAALALEPDNARVLALLGLTHFRANEFGEARLVYEQLVARAPSDASHRLNLGLVYLKLNDAARAIEALEASRGLDPSQGRAVSYLGLAYARAGRYGEAYRAFLIAGQNDLAVEIENNLTGPERDRIHAQLGRTPQGPLPVDDRVDIQIDEQPVETGPAASTSTVELGPAPALARPSRGHAATPVMGAPRTKPPVAPPKREDAPPADADEMPPRAVDEPRAPRRPATESMQFVMPRGEPAAPQPLDGPSMISRAVAVAAPPTIAAPRTRAGGTPPRPLSELATDELIRPDDGDDPFELAPGGALIIRVTDRVMTRLEGVHITGGDLAYELAMRRSRGHNTDEPFDHGGARLHAVSGRGYLIAVPGKHAFSAVTMDDDILYLREDLVFAFEASLRWENGHVPGLRGKLPVVQFRGDGALALRTTRPLVRVKLPPQGTVFIDAERLAGWVGRVIPRAVVPPANSPLGATCVECTGEGIVLVEPAPDMPVAPVVVAEAPAPASAPEAPAAEDSDPLGPLDEL